MGYRNTLAIAAAGTVAMLALPAVAQERATRVSHAAIMSGDLRSAEQVLDAERRIFPKRAELLLNLAAVYARSNRANEAVALYDQVLGGEDAMMDVSEDRTVSAHAVARLGKSRLRNDYAAR